MTPGMEEFMDKKILQLTAEPRNYKDKVTGESKTFLVFVTEVNGIPLQLRAPDNTTRAILEQYFTSLDK